MPHAGAITDGEAQRRAAREEAEQTKKRLAGAVRWEHVSQRLIAKACDEAGLSGVRVTNVVFVPDDLWSKGSYVAQVDHVLLSRKTLMLIENKHWQGIVFDGAKPSAVCVPASSNA